MGASLRNIAAAVLCALVFGLGLGYFFGYDHGFERAIGSVEREQ